MCHGTDWRIFHQVSVPFLPLHESEHDNFHRCDSQNRQQELGSRFRIHQPVQGFPCLDPQGSSKLFSGVLCFQECRRGKNYILIWQSLSGSGTICESMQAQKRSVQNAMVKCGTPCQALSKSVKASVSSEPFLSLGDTVLDTQLFKARNIVLIFQGTRTIVLIFHSWSTERLPA